VTTAQTHTAKKRANGANGHGKHGAVKQGTKSSRYSLEFKQTALRRVAAGEPVEEVAKSMGCNGVSIYAWRKTMPSAKIVSADTPSAKHGTKKHYELSDNVVRDAILYLRNARTAIMRQITSGKIKELDDAQLLTLLALKSLEGG
jgi:transposase-like protein